MSQHLTLVLQKALNRAGFGPLTEDGKRGPKTQAALAAFEQYKAGCPQGPDVSKWQTKCDWAAVKASGATFAYTKATQGTGRDGLFGEHWQGIKAAGLLRGAYHWLSPQVSLVAQADAVFKAVGKLGPGDLPVALDIERDGVGADGVAGTPDDIKATDAMAEKFAVLIEERTGKKPLVYSYGSYLDQRNIEVPSCNLWLADYRSGPGTVPPGWKSYAFHQYAGDNGRQPGIVGPCDCNYFNGSLEQLRAMAGL